MGKTNPEPVNQVKRPADDPSNMIFVIDTAKTLIYFTYDPVMNSFHGNGDRIGVAQMIKLATWLAERLPPIPGITVPGGF